MTIEKLLNELISNLQYSVLNKVLIYYLLFYSSCFCHKSSIFFLLLTYVNESWYKSNDYFIVLEK